MATSHSSQTDFEEAPRLKGHLNSNGISRLEIDTSESSRAGLNSLRTAIQVSANSSSGESETASSPSDQGDIEDYDTLRTMAHNSNRAEKRSYDGDETLEKVNNPRHSELKKGVTKPAFKKMKSIPVILKKSDQEGKYFLRADDAEIRKLLKMGIEREASPKTQRKFRDLMFTSQFSALDRQNKESPMSPFRGFVTLVWLSMAIFVAQTVGKNLHNYGNLFGSNEIMTMSRRDIIVLGLSDGVMFLSTSLGWILQVLISKNFLSWEKEGWIIQSAFEILWLGFGIQWTLVRDWPWTHTVFFVLHILVFLMKIHSYAFYNGHLSEAYKKKSSIERKLKQLQTIRFAEEPKDEDTGEKNESVHESVENQPQISQVAKAIESGEALNANQVQAFERILKLELESLNEDLKGKASSEEKSYPHNLTLKNHFEFGLLPTLVYELEYPRQETRDWFYIFEKSCAVLGILFIMNLVGQTFIYPVVMRAVEMKEANLLYSQRLLALPFILNDLIFPFVMEYILAWYLIWECILNLLAELTYFSDRGFYADWWNSVSWDQFARDWNRPVHVFLLRHVYHSSISTLRVNKYTATLITFLLSSIVHELVMWCLFKRLRGYLFALQMLQIPWMRWSRSKWLSRKPTLGNVMFWVSIVTAPGLISTGYLLL